MLRVNITFIFKEQAMRGGGGGGMGGKNYDSVSNSDRDGYGQPDGMFQTFENI